MLTLWNGKPVAPETMFMLVMVAQSLPSLQKFYDSQRSLLDKSVVTLACLSSFVVGRWLSTAGSQYALMVYGSILPGSIILIMIEGHYGESKYTYAVRGLACVSIIATAAILLAKYTIQL